MEFEQVTSIIGGINSKFCEPPLSAKELELIIGKKWQQKLLGEFTPIKNEQRRIILNPVLELTTKVKHQLVGSINGQYRKKRSLKKFCDCIEEHQIESLKGDNLRKMKECTGNGKTTLYKYWEMVF